MILKRNYEIFQNTQAILTMKVLCQHSWATIKVVLRGGKLENNENKSFKDSTQDANE